MKIVTYNLRAGGAGKSHWQSVIAELDPEVFLVQESFEPIQHLPLLIHGNRYRDACWRSVAGLKWGSAVCVKDGQARPLELPDFHGHVVGVEVRGTTSWCVAGQSLRIFSVHAPNRGGYQRAVHSILDMIGQHPGDGDLVIGGDFNLTVGKRLDGEVMQTSKADLAILDRLRHEFGLISAWQAANPGLPLPQTLRWAKDKVAPFHCDGIFIPVSWSSRLRTCRVVSGPEWDRLSDHNPVVAEIA